MNKNSIKNIKFTKFFIGNLPKRKQILGAYSVIVTIVYSWTLIVSFYKLPSWLFFLPGKEIASIYAYVFSIAFLDSLLMLALVLFLEMSVFLLLKDRSGFLARAVVIALVLGGTAALRLIFLQKYEYIAAFINSEVFWWGCAFLLATILSLLVPRSKLARDSIESFSDRAVVFVYIYLPFSVISLIVVLLRNLS